MKRIILLNGPSSSGKSTIAKKLQEAILKRDGEKYEIISLDDYLKPTVNQPIWEDDVYVVSNDMNKDIIRALAQEKGIIIDHVITSERIYEEIVSAVMTKYPDAMASVTQVRVICSLETLKEREKKRGDRYIGTAESSFLYLYPQNGYDLFIDTGRIDADTAVCSIMSN